MKLLVTGGAGFIGSALVRHYLDTSDATIINVDKLTYAGHLGSLDGRDKSSRHVFEQQDICDADAIARIFEQYQPDNVIHLAAETHVDKSISGPAEFVRTNVQGTQVLLSQAEDYWRQLATSRKTRFRFLHVSTDEVFGDVGPNDPPFNEASHYAPSSPYAASKAGADHLVRAWHRTHGLPVLITNCSNNYGPFQFPEKLIPLMILNALAGQPLPVYGDGMQIRDWLHVDDHVRALACVLSSGVPGNTYLVGAQSERTNLEIVEEICRILAQRTGQPLNQYLDLITKVSDRPGHDRRYAIDATKLTSELGWHANYDLSSGLEQTVDWYLDHSDWLRSVETAEYASWIKKNYNERVVLGGQG